MSALDQRRHEHLSRPRARFLVSDDDLRRLIGRRHTTALHVMLYVRKRAVLKGRLEIAVTNVELERELGVDRRQIQRAKAHLREVGFPIVERLGRHKGRDGKSGNLACLFVLDRRDVEPLKQHLSLVRDEEHGGAVPDAVLVKEENTTQTSVATPKHSSVWWPAAPRAGPLPADGAASSTPDGEPATEAQRAPVPPSAGSVEDLEQWPVVDRGFPVAAQLEPELTRLRAWWSAAKKPALDGERAAAVLDRGVAAVVGEGGSPFKARLARALLERELGLHQLSLNEGTPAGEKDHPPPGGLNLSG